LAQTRRRRVWISQSSGDEVARKGIWRGSRGVVGGGAGEGEGVRDVEALSRL